MTKNTSYGLVNNFDLSTFFNSTDIDKVAGAAFKVSFNELFALVLLLLIAIIVVLSISRTFDDSNEIIANRSESFFKPNSVLLEFLQFSKTLETNYANKNILFYSFIAFVSSNFYNNKFQLDSRAFLNFFYFTIEFTPEFNNKLNFIFGRFNHTFIDNYYQKLFYPSPFNEATLEFLDDYYKVDFEIN